MTASENPILAEIQAIRSKGVQPKHNDVYDEIKPELFTEALNGQVAIVTGSGRGIGKFMALALARAGCNLFLVSRTQKEIDGVAEEAKQANPSITAVAYAADQSKTSELENAVEAAIATFRSIDLLINNAAINYCGPFDTFDMDKWWKMYEVNVKGPVTFTSLVLPHMASAGKGRIINIISEAAAIAPPMMTAYCSTKSAVLNFTTSLQEELNYGPIRAFALHPGGIGETSLVDFGSTKTGEPDARMLAGADPSILPLFYPDTADLSAQTVVYIATGKADALAGLYLSANDNITELISRVDEIKESRLYKLTVNHLPSK